LVSVPAQARSIWSYERQAPFDALQTDYWNLTDTPNKLAFIAEVDRQWLDIIPEIKDAFGGATSDRIGSNLVPFTNKG
jgi:hypothetical protein